MLIPNRAEGSGRNIWNRLGVLHEVLRTSIWPIPVVMLVLAVVLRQMAVWVDSLVENDVAMSLWWLHSGSGDDARNLLSTLVTALITMASVMFSITMVVLSLAANQFGSRLVRTYMADIRTQLSLGIFVMTVVYCLLVLRTVQKDMPVPEVPHVAVTLSLFLGLLCILTLLLFLHVIARSMVADDVIRRVAAELQQSLSKLPPLKQSVPRSREDLLEHEGEPLTIRSAAQGYVQIIDYDRLRDICCRSDLNLRLFCKAGAFMCHGGWLAEVSPASALTPEVEKQIQEAVEIGALRTPTQDLEFLVRYLVDIALRALSPGINDPRTATVVIDHLRASLAQMLTKEIESAVRYDGAGRLRVAGQDTRYGAIFDEAFHQIRQIGAVQPAIVLHLLGAIDRLAEHVQLSEQRDALIEHVLLIADAGLAKAEADRDRSDIAVKRNAALSKLRGALPADTSPETEEFFPQRSSLRQSNDTAVHVLLG